MRERKPNIWRNDSWQFSKFKENYKPTDPRISTNSKESKTYENYITVYLNQTSGNKNVFKAAGESKYRVLHCGKIR